MKNLEGFPQEGENPEVEIFRGPEKFEEPKKLKEERERVARIGDVLKDPAEEKVRAARERARKSLEKEIKEAA